MKRYTFAIGTFTCLIIRLLLLLYIYLMEEVHQLRTLFHYHHILPLGEKRKTLSIQQEKTSIILFTRNSDTNVPSSNSRIKPCIAPRSRIDHASVPDIVFDCSS